MRSTRTTRPLAVAALALLLTGAAACGASGGSDAEDTTTTTAVAGDPTTTTGADEPGSTTTEADRTTTTEDTTDTTATSGSADEQAYVDALVSTFDEDDADDFTEEQVACLAEEWVAIVGVDGFEAKGITPADLASEDKDFDDLQVDEPTAQEMVGAMDGCGIEIRDLFLDELTGGDDVTAEQRSCVEAAVTDEAIRDLLVAGFTGDDPGTEPLDQAADCLR